MRRVPAGALAILLLAGSLTLGPGSGTAQATTPGVRAQQVPPVAPSPTDSGNSPAAPDPHPPRGGLGIDGRPVGGAALLSRSDVLPAGAPPLPADLTARAFMVTDLDTGAVIAARDAHGRYQPASILKVLTSATLMPLLPGSRRVTVSRSAAETEGSHAGLVAGGSYTVDQLFEGLLLVSGNDCAEALAQAAGGRARTVALMNATALQLGAVDTLVQTPSGLDGWQQLTSAYDMTLFLRAALAQPRFARYDTVRRTTLPVQKVNGFGPVQLDNQNVEFLDTVKGALVAKTGFTDAAQHTFAGAIRRNGHRYGVVMMRAQRYPDDQWVQATKLVAWAATLPAGTKPVGTLVSAESPVVPSASPSASTTHAAAVSKATAGDTGGIPLWVKAGLLVLVIGGAGVLTKRFGRVG